MVSVQVFFISAGLLLLFICKTGEAIKCFECNSHNDTRCALEKPPTELEVDCSTKKTEPAISYILCRKISQTIEFEVNGLQPDSRVIRSCGWDDSNYKERCYQRSGFGGRQEVCSCTTDLCNGSTSPVAVPLLMAVAATCLVVRRWLS